MSKNNDIYIENRASSAAKKINKLNIPDEIKKQLIDKKVFDFWFNNKELRALSDNIDIAGGESIQYAASGNYDNHTALIICTNMRVMIINKNMFIGGDFTDIPLNMINGVSIKTRLFLSDIQITNGATNIFLNDLDKTAAPILADAIKSMSKNYQQSIQNVPVQNATENTQDMIAELKQLKELVDEGILTEEEFAAKKKQILGL